MGEQRAYLHFPAYTGKRCNDFLKKEVRKIYCIKNVINIYDVILKFLFVVLIRNVYGLRYNGYAFLRR